jgi:hypothetical protein
MMGDVVDERAPLLDVAGMTGAMTSEATSDTRRSEAVGADPE